MRLMHLQPQIDSIGIIYETMTYWLKIQHIF